ncbi:LysR substrate-binding domain-containing protein [Marinobacter alexandrii]|uniref:LysR substrate-binding domain-containing protein n=3 Tax=Marinobacter alexandrii TaxID=2570351 RepID=UPI0032645342
MPTKLNLPSMNGLRAFESAGRHLTFRAAAEELGVTQGAVAQQVRGLESDLGIRLFLRESRGLALTAQGHDYHAAVSRSLAQISSATERLQPSPSKVTISATPTFASKWLIPRLAEFTEQHSDIDLRVTATEKVLSFYTDGIDLAIRQGEPPPSAYHTTHLLFPQEIVAVCSPALFTDGPKRLPLGELANFPLLHDTHDLWPSFLEMLGGPTTPQIRGLRFSQTTLCIDAALAGQGVALASRFLVERDLNDGRLIQPVLETLKGEQNFYLLAPRHDQSVAARKVSNWLKKYT